MPKLLPGMAVTDSIRLVRKLGEGGMGTVWVAHHARLGADVVVKFLGPATVDEPEAATRFANEAAMVARVRSPHIVQVLDFGTLTDDQPFIVMELLEGEDLESRLRRETKLSLSETVRIVTQVAKGLARAHDRGIVHRDIKPANVFLCEVGAAETFVKVLDFGVAKNTAASGELRTASGAVVGTPAYASPEQLVGSRDVDARSDLWALAAVTFRALTGTRPFAGDTMASLALAIHHGSRRSACVLEPLLPPAVEGWFERAFHRDRNVRFPSAIEMSDALVAAAASAAVTTVATPTTIPQHAGRRPEASTAESDAAMFAPTIAEKASSGVQMDPEPRRPAPRPRRAVAVLGAATVALALAAVAMIAFASRPSAAPAASATSATSATTAMAPGSSGTRAEPAASAFADASVLELPTAPPAQRSGAPASERPSGATREPRARATPPATSRVAPQKERDIE